MNINNIPPISIGVATVVVMILIMGVSNFTFKNDFDNSQMKYIEGPLTKNTELQIKDGEEYTYSFWYNETQINASYIVFRSGNCMAIQFLESKDPQGVCLDRWGNDRGGYNSTYEEPMILPIRPWMLALHDGWTWNTTTYLSYGEKSAQYVATTEYRVLRTENYKGRLAYVVLENASNSLPIYQWVDCKKRILLRVVGEGFEIELTEGIPSD